MTAGRIESAEALATLMQRIGFALWQLQELETAVATYVVVRLKAHRGMGAEQAARLEAAAERRTFGALRRDLADSGVLGATILTALDALLAERNWLVHRSRRGSRAVLAQPAVYQELSGRLDRIADDALSCLKTVAAEVESYVTSVGVDRDLIDREANRLIEQWGLFEPAE